jgi:hypothetical protein
MTKRREFTKATKAAIIRRAEVPTGFKCEQCGAIVTSGDVDHTKPDGLEIDKTRKLTADDGRFLCHPCHKVKTADDVAVIAKAKRVEARHLGIVTPKAKIASRGFAKRERQEKLGLPPRRFIYEDAT